MNIEFPYTYCPLQHDEIRLLHLFPGSCADGLEITLKHVGLGQGPRFEALSYTWGTSAKDCHVRCKMESGRLEKIPITRNLEQALVRLRSVEDVKVLWIDQVCINQDDLQERCSQVSYMGTIYSTAFQVSVWIGEEDEDTRLAFDFLPVLFSYLPTSELDANMNAQYVLPAHALLIARSPSWEALVRIFHRPWFRRIWVIQEAAVASCVTVHCGTLTVTWEDLVRACKCQIRSEDVRYGHNALEAIDKTRRGRLQGGNDLYDICFMSYRFQCTDPRDKIYAVAGLVNQSLEDTKPLLVDYESDIEEIYHRNAVGIMLSDGSLDLLHCVVHHTIPSSLPSWVPDWRSEALVQCMFKRNNGNNSRNQQISPTCFSLSEDLSALTVTGRIIGTVVEIGCMMTLIKREDYFLQWRDMARRISRPGGDSFPGAFSRTLIAATSSSSFSDCDSHELFYAAYDNVIRRNNGIAGHQVPDNLQEETQRSTDFAGRMLETCIGRKMFVIDGDMIALGPSEISMGDIVCCFEDTSTFIDNCYVIRRVKLDDSCELVGEAYIYGLDTQEGAWFLPRFLDLPKYNFVLR